MAGHQPVSCIILTTSPALEPLVACWPPEKKDRGGRGITSYFDAQGNIKDFSKIRMSILSALICCGMTPRLPRFEKAGAHKLLNVLLDGCVIGIIDADKATETVAYLRNLKMLANSMAFMEIRCPDGRDGGSRLSSFPTTHEEVHPTSMLSVVANLTPWSDHNQSPRNMYQCQVRSQGHWN
ncbi:hypothetical protein EJ110_NYTH49966 [Nymphaea thermarum]|nr:hypothetical protein EJ110_NYTH49966 [Nymphaea thermarum]